MNADSSVSCPLASDAITVDLIRCNGRLEPLLELRSELERKLTKALSVEFIEANKITKGEVQMSGGSGVPYFGLINVFNAWLRDQPNRKPWAEWNGRVYRTADLIANRMANTPVRVEDLLEDKP